MNFRPLLIGLAAGQRSMTPLAAVALAARAGGLAPGNDAPSFLGGRCVAVGATLLAVGEILGDKMNSAPDRTVPPGLAARLISGGLAGAAMAPRALRGRAAALGAVGAVVGGYAGLALRKRAMRRYGQRRSGLVEDVLTLAATALITASAARDPERRRSGRPGRPTEPPSSMLWGRRRAPSPG